MYYDTVYYTVIQYTIVYCGMTLYTVYCPCVHTEDEIEDRDASRGFRCGSIS